MNKVVKGEYGYIKNYKKSKLFATIVLFAMIAFIIVTLIIMFGDTKRVGVVFAILLTLPFAKYLIAYIMVAKFSSLDKETYDKICNSIKGEQLIYDVVLAKYEGMRFYYSICVKNGWVYALVPEKNFKENKSEYTEWIKNTVHDGKYEYKIGIYCNPEEFIKKVKNAGSPNDKNKIIDKYIKDRFIEMGV